MKKLNMENKSEKLRVKGNLIFKSISENLDSYSYNTKMFEAINLYEESLKYSNNQDDCFKAFKNIVISKTKMFNKTKSKILDMKNFQYLNYICEELLESYLSFLKQCRSFFDNLQFLSQIKNLQEILFNYLNSSNEPYHKYETLIKFWQKLNNKISWDYPNLKIILLYQIIKKYFSEGIFYYQKESYVKSQGLFMNSLQLTKETLYTYRNYKNFDFKNHFIFKTIVDDKQYFNIPNNENKDICYLQEIFDELEEMQENCDFYLLRCDVNNKILKADKIFSDSINEDETINMELFYNCLDFYREAYITINSWNKDSSPDIELEAILSSKLGYILFKVLKNIDRSKILLKMAVDLGLSLYPKNVSLEEWYRKASNTLTDIRILLQNEEEDLIKQGKQKYLDELKDILEKIDQEANKVLADHNKLKDFLKFILENHKPLNDLNYKPEEELAKTTQRKVLLQIIKFYHPDKYGMEDLKNKILMEEITKRLNDIYTYFK